LRLLTYGVGPFPHPENKIELFWGAGQGLPLPGGVPVEQRGEAVVLGEYVTPMADGSVLKS